jgi:6-phosphogluconolactonase (cycloisomerase 2 family)
MALIDALRGLVQRRSAAGRGELPVDPEPILVHYTPDSILSDPPGTALRLGERSRVATCSGVAWFHGDHVATVNLQGNALHTYRFDPGDRTLIPVQALFDLSGLAWPDNLAFSPDGRLLAITNSRDGAVHLYTVDWSTHRVSTEPACTIQHDGDVNPHGVGFSPCSRFLAFTTVDSPGWIRLHGVSEAGGGALMVTPLQQLRNELAPLKPKGIDFSPDGRFAVVCYASNVTRDASLNGRLHVHLFHGEAGLGARPVSRGGADLRLGFPDDLKFFRDGSHLVASDQANDSAIVVGFDASTGALGELRMVLENPRARLSFPHGVGISPDGRHLAITSYGDDKLTIYAIRSGERPSAA